MWENIMIVLRGFLHVFEEAAFPFAILVVVVVAIIGLNLLWSWQKGKDEARAAAKLRRPGERPLYVTQYDSEGNFTAYSVHDDGFVPIERLNE